MENDLVLAYDRRMRMFNLSVVLSAPAEKTIIGFHHRASARFSGQQRKRGSLAGLDGAVALRVDTFSLRDL
jgi:hypothetical protein